MPVVEGVPPEGTTCVVRVNDSAWSSHICGKRARGFVTDWVGQDPQPACGVHLSAEQRREDKAEKETEERGLDYAAQQYAKESCEKLKAIGIKAAPYKTSWGGPYGMGKYTGEVILNPRDILERLDAASQPEHNKQ